MSDLPIVCPEKLETLPLTVLKPHDRNPRTHTKKQIRQIADSIKRFGFTNPVLVDGENRIIAGHGRVEAARLIGMTTVPVLRLEHMTEADGGPMSWPTTGWRNWPAGTMNCLRSNWVRCSNSIPSSTWR